VDDFPPPEFFNPVLWGQGLFEAQRREPTTEWEDMAKRLYNRGNDLHRKGDDERIKKLVLAEYFYQHPDAPAK
jgi:hypothetical protein